MRTVDVENPSVVLCVDDLIFVTNYHQVLQVRGEDIEVLYEAGGCQWLCLSPDKKTLYFAQMNKLIGLDLVSKKVVDSWNTGGEGPCSILMRPDDPHVYVATAGGDCRAKKYLPGKSRTVKGYYLGREADLLWLEDTLLVMSNYVWQLNPEDMSGVEHGFCRKYYPPAVVFGGKILVGHDDGGLHILDLDDTENLQCWWNGPKVNALSPTGDGRLLVGTFDHGVLILDENAKSEEVAAPFGLKSEIVSVSASERFFVWAESTQRPDEVWENTLKVIER